MSGPSPLPQWLAWVRRLQAVSQTGLEYATDPFDRERYREIQAIAAAIAAGHSALPEADLLSVFASQSGYATPKVDVRAAVFHEGKILLVRERSDGLWTLPGGWADVGLTPAECAEKEALEESGCRVRATRLLALLDRDRQGHPPLLFHVYKVFIECELLSDAPLAANPETDAVGFFAPGALPPLSLTRILPRQVERLFELHSRPGPPPDLD